MNPTCSRGIFSGPNNLRLGFSRHSPHSCQSQTYLTHFRAIDSACSSIVLESHVRCSDGPRAVYESRSLDSGSTKGMMSSSAHRREVSSVQWSATRVGIAIPTIFSRCFSMYGFNVPMTNSVASSAHDDTSDSNCFSTKSSKYVASRIAMAIVVVLFSLDEKPEMPA